MSLAYSPFSSAAFSPSPVSVIASGLPLAEAWRLRHDAVRENRVIPFIIVIAIVVILALAVTVIAGSIIVCAIHGGVFDTVANIKNGMVSVKCHRF
jgi:uncharacterized membrane protein